MSGGRDARLAASMAGLRSPLARIELAAGQLARDAATPAGRELARGISAAVGEIDAGLDVVLRALAGAATPLHADCRPALERTWQRLAPVVRARGVAARLGLPEGSVAGNGEAVRRAAVALIADGLAAARPGDRLALRLHDEAARYGVSLECGAPGAAAGFPRARALALALPARLEVAPDAPGAMLWLSRGAPG